MTAAENIVKTANAVKPYTSIASIQAGLGSETDLAWHNFLVGQTSCYWYWDGTKEWDSLPTLAANQATDHAISVAGAGADVVGPSIYTLQRIPYNPGEYEWGKTPESSDFTVWTFIYDISGVKSASLKYRMHDNIVNDSNRVYGGSPWNTIEMTGKDYPAPKTDPLPKYRAQKYSGTISLSKSAYVDYYVEVEDGKGNVSKSDIYHTWVTVLEKPVPPTNVSASAGSSSKITVSWTAAPGISSYNVYMSNTPDGTFDLEGTTTGVICSISGLACATTYYFKVASVNPAGTSDFSSAVSATTKDKEIGINVTIHYKTSWDGANLHYNNGISWTTPPGEKMTSEGSGWFKDTVLRDASASIITFCFNHNGSDWDNNSGQNYKTSLTEAWAKSGTIYDHNPEE